MDSRLQMSGMTEKRGREGLFKQFLYAFIAGHGEVLPDVCQDC